MWGDPMTAAATQPTLMTEFHADVVREVLEEFPNLREKAERLIREKKIKVIEENNKVRRDVIKNC